MIGNAVPVNLAKFLAESIMLQIKSNEISNKKVKKLHKVKEAIVV